ncbi:MAG: hypothetical protein RLY76_687 [Actinomycetota bacterium]|jgi:hypothetical protein
MKETRASFALLFFIIAAHIAHLLPQTNVTSEITQNYPASVCPGPVGDARATALLPSKNTTFRSLAKPKSELRKNGQGSFLQNDGAIFIAGNPINNLQIQSKQNRWTAAVNCEVGNNTSWFAGGTANVTSQTKLVLVNSGLGEAIVDVTSYSENGSTASVPITVKASSEKIIRVDSFDPGSSRIVLKVETRSGRIASFMLDERVRGLNNLGADFVSPIFNPDAELIIAGIPIRYGNSNKAKHTLRLMSTSNVDANASVEIISPEGVFIPVGLGEISLKAQTVKDFDLADLDLGNKTFAIKINATAPVVGGIFTELKTGGVSDFMWSAPSNSFGNVSFNLYGLEPTVTFVGEKILVNVNWKNNRGKEFSKTLIGDEVLNWKVPSGVRLISFTNQSGVKAGMNWISRDGVTHLPVKQNTDLESATKPVADISVIRAGK